MDWGAALLTSLEPERVRSLQVAGDDSPTSGGRRDARLHGARTVTSGAKAVDARADVYRSRRDAVPPADRRARPAASPLERLASRRDVPAALRAICARAMAVRAAPTATRTSCPSCRTCGATAPGWPSTRILKRSLERTPPVRPDLPNGYRAGGGVPHHEDRCRGHRREVRGRGSALRGSAFEVRRSAARRFGVRRLRGSGPGHRIRTATRNRAVEAENDEQASARNDARRVSRDLRRAQRAGLRPRNGPRDPRDRDRLDVQRGAGRRARRLVRAAGAFGPHRRALRAVVRCVFRVPGRRHPAAVRRALLLADHAARQRARDDRRLRHAAIRPPILRPSVLRKV